MAEKRQSKHRKIYAEYYGIEIPDSMDIHHIDEDRENNDITNLLMLPRELHERYHYWKREYDRFSQASFDGLLLGRNQLHFGVYEKFGAVCCECLFWVTYKAQMDASKSLGVVLYG